MGRMERWRVGRRFCVAEAGLESVAQSGAEKYEEETAVRRGGFEGASAFLRCGGNGEALARSGAETCEEETAVSPRRI